MITIEERNQLHSNANVPSEQLVDLRRSDRRVEDRPQLTETNSHGFFHFASELRRRSVCRAAVLYAVAMWLVCQIVGLVYIEFGLPEWTLKFVIVLGLVGFPIALILSWLFDITPEGVVADDGSNRSSVAEGGPRGRLDQVIDCSLVLVALIIGGNLAFGALSTESVAASAPIQRIAIMPFRAAAGGEANALAQALVTDLQHEIVSKTRLTVIVPRGPLLSANSVSLTGSIAVDEEQVRVTVTLIDNDSDEVTWTKVFQHPKSDSLAISAEIAREIVLALPVSLRVSRTAGERHES